MKISVILIVLLIPFSLFSSPQYEFGISGIYEEINLRESSGKKSTSGAYFFQYDKSNLTNYGGTVHFYRSFLMTKGIYFKTGPSYSYSVLKIHDQFPDDFTASGKNEMKFMYDFKILFNRLPLAAPYIICGSGFTQIKSTWRVKSLNMEYVEKLYGFAFDAGGGVEYKYSPVIHIFAQGQYILNFLSPEVDGDNDKYIQDGNKLKAKGWRLDFGVNFNL